MAGIPSVRVMEQLRAAAERDGSAPTDGELLDRFIDHRDEYALAALVHRHGPMVWRVCRRLLAHHDAEDAFQATFLVLVRKAASVRPREAVANWLYGVAHRSALMARRTATRRKVRESQVSVLPEAAATPPDPCDHAPLDQELSRLPDRFRAVLVLCDLEGRTRTEAARQLGVPEGTVAGRLARARALLAKRLTRRGVALVVGAMAASSVPESVANAVSAGPVSPAVEALSTQVLQAMTTSKLKAVAAAVVGVLAFTTLAVGLAGDKPLAPERPKVPDDPAERLVGTWTVKFENEVNEWCRVNKDHSAKVVEPLRRSPGKVEVRDGAVLIVCDDDRLERWTPVGDAAVVEHWFPASAYPKEKPVKGIAERTTADEPPESPPHFVEKPDMQPQFAWLPHKVEGEVTEETIYVASKEFIADIRNPGKVRFRDFIDPRYLKKHGLTDKDLAYEIGDNTGLRNYHLADDLRTILFVVDAKGGGKELIVARWVVYEGRLYLSPEKGPDPKTGIFTLWMLRTKFDEAKQSPPTGTNDTRLEKPPHVVEKADMKGRMESGLPHKLGQEPTEENIRVVTKMFSSKMRTYPDIRFREFFDPRYLKKRGLTDKDIAFEVAGDRGIHDYTVADDNRTTLVTMDSTKDGKVVRELFLLRWVCSDGCLYVSPEKAPDEKTGIFTPWILRTKP